MSDDYPRIQTIVDEWRRSTRTAIAIDNGGQSSPTISKRTCYIYRSIYLLKFSHLQSCKLLPSCGCQHWTGPELFAKKINLFPCNFTRTNRKQAINNRIGETMRDEVIVMFGCVKMVYLDVPSRDRSRNVEDTSATEALPCSFVLRPCKPVVSLLIICSVTVRFYECVTVYRNKPGLSLALPSGIVMESYLNLTVYNRRRTLLVPLLSVVSPFETGFTTVHHDFIIRAELWWIVVRTVTV